MRSCGDERTTEPQRTQRETLCDLCVSVVKSREIIRRMFRNALLIVIALLSAAPAEARRRSATAAFPPCAMITGTAAVTFTRDGGRTLTPAAQTPTAIGYTYGLAAIDDRGAMLAWHGNDLLLSRDHGCSWRVEASFPNPDFPPRITPTGDGRAYAWSDNRSFLVRYDRRATVKLKQPVAFVGLGVDPDNGDHVRAGGDDGTLWESFDAGETWTYIGSLRADTSPVIFYRFVFDPSDIDHIVAGMTQSGAYATRDGGKTWTRASGFGSGLVNAFNFAISPADGNVVWAMAINLAESDANLPSRGRHIFRSTDGGMTYGAVVDESPAVKLINGPIMAAHPTDPAVVYFVFGTYFQGYGSDVFRFDASSGALTVNHNSADDINAITFSPRDPNLMYLGLESERGIR
jgi:hypothetical protein